MKTRREQLTPQTRARTILAACAEAHVQVLGEAPGDGAEEQLGLLLDSSGSAWLVLPEGGRAPSGLFRITCRARIPGLGVLRLDGRADAPAPAAAQVAVAELLAGHRLHWPATADEPGELVLVPVDLVAVTVLTPATDARRAEAVPVEVWDFRMAGPDEWLLYADAFGAHLEEHHQRELLALVRRHLRPDPDTDLVVSIQELTPESVRLACLSLDGVTALEVAFGTSLDHPGQVAEWMAQATA